MTHTGQIEIKIERLVGEMEEIVKTYGRTQSGESPQQPRATLIEEAQQQETSDEKLPRAHELSANFAPR